MPRPAVRLDRNSIARSSRVIAFRRTWQLGGENERQCLCGQVARGTIFVILAMHASEFCIGDIRHDPAQHAIDDVILQGERIVRRTIETVAPQMTVGVDIDQPLDDAGAIINPPQAAHQGILGAAIPLPAYAERRSAERRIAR